MKVTTEQLVDLLSKMDKPTLAELVVAIEPTMVKKHRETSEPNPYLGRVKKQSIVSGVIGGWNYTTAVQQQRVREATDEEIALQQVEQFEAKPRQWGERVKNSALVSHKGAFYVEMNIKSVPQSTYLVDGRLATPEEMKALKNYLPKPTEEGKRQEVEAPVILRDYKLSSVKVLLVQGVQYEVV